MHFKNARNASVYAVFRAFFTQSLAKLRYYSIFISRKQVDKKLKKISTCAVGFTLECPTAQEEKFFLLIYPYKGKRGTHPGVADPDMQRFRFRLRKHCDFFIAHSAAFI